MEHRCDVCVAGEGSKMTEWHRNGVAHCLLCRADQGRLLDCVVRWGNLTEGKIRAYLGEVLEGVRYLHNCRIAHLDLKVRGAPGVGSHMSDPGMATRDLGPAPSLSSASRPGDTREQ